MSHHAPRDPHDLPSVCIYLPQYLLRIRQNRGSDGEALTCAFDLVKCWPQPDGHSYRYARDCRFLHGPGPHDGSTADLAQAELQLEGFVKWDGCTQLWVNRVHVDDLVDLDAFLEAIREARRLCAGHLGRDVASEYR